MANQDRRGVKRGPSSDAVELKTKRLPINGMMNLHQSSPQTSGWGSYHLGPMQPLSLPRSWQHSSISIPPSSINISPSSLCASVPPTLPSATDLTPGPTSLCLLPNCRLSASTSGIDKRFCGYHHYLDAKYTILLELKSDLAKYQKACKHFISNWSYKKSAPPSTDDIVTVFKIFNPDQKKVFKAYTKTLSDKTVEKHYHGTSVKCDLVKNKTACANKSCGVCGISRRGFDKSLFATNIPWFTRFGEGFYLAPNSSKCHDYTQGIVDYRVMLLCKVAPGNKYTVYNDRKDLTAPPQGYDSVYGARGRRLNYDEIVLYCSEAILPLYAIVYRRDGIDVVAKR